MRALVTGGAGFVGSHVVDRQLEEGLEATRVDDPPALSVSGTGLMPNRFLQVERYNSREPSCDSMSLTVKLDRRRKAEVERFVASLVLEEGVKVTFQEALGLMVDYSMENSDAIVKRLKRLPPLEKDPAWKLLHQPEDWGVDDASERVDEFLYGVN